MRMHCATRRRGGHRALIPVAATIGALMVLTACGGGSTDSSSASGAAGEPCTVKVGVATGQTGGLAYVDVPNLEGFDIWKEEINAAGGIDGKFTVETIVKDTRSEPAQTATVAAELLGEGISFLRTTPQSRATPPPTRWVRQTARTHPISRSISPPPSPPTEARSSAKARTPWASPTSTSSWTRLSRSPRHPT